MICRNNAMRPEVLFLQYDSPHDTDILQEHFVPVSELAGFLDAFRAIVLRRNINLVNATIRFVPKDAESFLSYARQDSFAIVVLLNQALSASGRKAADTWTREFIDAALARGGAYYLPYQNYATSEQLQKAYPQIDDFFAKKKVYDPDFLTSPSRRRALRMEHAQIRVGHPTSVATVPSQRP